MDERLFKKRIDKSPLKALAQKSMEKGSGAITVHDRIGLGKPVTPARLKNTGIRVPGKMQ